MDTNRKIKVLIVDDYDLARNALIQLLEPSDDFEIIGKTDDLDDVLGTCSVFKPDVVLMDVVMPRMDSAEATHLIREKFPQIQIVGLSVSADEKRIYDVLEAGAISYVLKNSPVQDVIKTVQAAYHGTSTLTPEAIEALKPVQQKTMKVGYDLTYREHEILRLIVDGLNSGDIGKQLKLTPSTVKYYVTNILSKLAPSSQPKTVAQTIEPHRFAKV